MFGKIEKCIDPITGQEVKQAVTLSGPAEGVVSKVGYDCSLDYPMVLTNGGTGTGYVGLSTCRPIYYNPYCCVGDDDQGNPIYQGVLTVDCIKAGNIEGADCADLVYQNKLDSNLNYSVSLWTNASLVDNKYGEIGISDAYPLYYNPVTGTATTKCYKADSTLIEETGITFCCNSFSISGGSASLVATPTSIINSAQGVNVTLCCNSLSVTTPRVTMNINDDYNNPDITASTVCYYLDSCIHSYYGTLWLTCMCMFFNCAYTKSGEIGFNCGSYHPFVCVNNRGVCLQTYTSGRMALYCQCLYLEAGSATYCFSTDLCMQYNGPTCSYMWCSYNGMFYKRAPGTSNWVAYNPGAVPYCVCGNTLIFTI